MNKWLELLLGLILVVAPILIATMVWPSWWASSLEVLKGTVFWGIIGVGALFILLGISDIKG